MKTMTLWHCGIVAKITSNYCSIKSRSVSGKLPAPFSGPLSERNTIRVSSAIPSVSTAFLILPKRDIKENKHIRTKIQKIDLTCAIQSENLLNFAWCYTNFNNGDMLENTIKIGKSRAWVSAPIL